MNTKAQALVLFILLGVTALVWYGVEANESDVLTVAYLDVGQGDSVFIESPSGVQVLIDGGPGGSVLRELNHVMPFFDRKLDVVIATHPDKDHIGGLIDILEAYNVENIFISGAINETNLSTDFDEHVADEDTNVVIARRGQVIDLGSGVYLRILSPDGELLSADTNSSSIVTQLVYGDTEFLMTGDAPKFIEDRISILDGKTLSSDVLKVGHHGSKTSSSELFVGWVSPIYGVLSRGCDNRYGHPHTDTLSVLDKFEVSILDTCEEGSIIFESDGANVSIK